MARPRSDPTVSMPRKEGQLNTARLIWTASDGQENRAEIGRAAFVIGTDPLAEVQIDDPHVSRRHVKVSLTEEGVIVEDLGSSNGTFVNDVLIERAVLIQPAIIKAGKTAMRLEFGEPASEAHSFQDVVGASSAMLQVFRILEKLAPTEVSILLLGETGTGKDVLARAIHATSPRKKGPFAVFDSGAVAANLIESDLFGHEKGAFTGAVAAREGVFERGHTGTVFLDEIGELPLELQPRLLRVLEQRMVRRVGGDDHVPADVRVISATNRDLEAEVVAGRFRQDLFYRLSAAVVQIPPLRDRLEDIPALVDVFLCDLGNTFTIAPATLTALRSYDWPGNVRELRNVITSAAAIADGSCLEPRHLLFFKHNRRAPTLDRLPLAGRTLEALEEAAIRQTLLQTGGNKAKTARVLGIASSTLYEKLKKFGL